jgi:integrase
LARLGAVFREAKDPLAIAALRLIALTGLRRGEAFCLRWSEIDTQNQALRLESSKTGKSIRVIGKAALDLLQSLPRTSSPYVFPASRGKGSAALAHPIKRLFCAAGIEDAGLHDLRRGFASVGADMELADSTLAALLGHAVQGVTGKHYIRRSDATLIAAADKIAAAIEKAMGGKAAAVFPMDKAMRA